MEDRGEIEGYFPDEGRLGLSFAPQERDNPASPAMVTNIEPPLASSPASHDCRAASGAPGRVFRRRGRGRLTSATAWRGAWHA